MSQTNLSRLDAIDMAVVNLYKRNNQYMKRQDKEILECKEFLDVYFKLNEWLMSIGFNSEVSNTPADIDYTNGKYIDSLQGVEYYKHKILDIELRFMRDRFEHKLMFVGFISWSKVYSIDEFKEDVLSLVRKVRDRELVKFETIKHI